MARLGDLGKVITGNTPKTSDLQNYASNDICFVKPSDIVDGTVTYLDDSEFYISEHARTKARVLPPKSVLATCIGIIGKIAINNVECAFNQQINAIIPDNSKCLTEYLAYALQNKQAEMQDIANAPVVPILNKSQFSDIEIKLPSLAEQKKIVEKLNAVAELIALRKEQLVKLDQLVKSRFIELFDRYTETTKLSEVATVTGGLTKNSKRNQLPLRMPYLRVANVAFASIDVTEMLDIGLTRDEYEKTLLEYEDMLFVEGNGSPDQIGRVAIWRNEITPCVHQNHLIKARFNQSKVKPVFAMHYFMSQSGREQIKSKAVSTSGLFTLSVSKVADLLMPVPPMDIQEDFVAFVEQTDKSKLAIQQSLEKLETLKKSLMQQYFG